MRGPGYRHHWLWPFGLPPAAQYHSVLFLLPLLCCSRLKNTKANIPIVLSFFLLYSYSLPSFGVYAYCSLEHPHYTHGYILRASLFDFGLVGSERWAGGSCRAGPALRAPQPASRRVGLGGIIGLGTSAEALVLLLVQGGGCERKIEKSIRKAAQKKRKKEREGETKGDGELQKAESNGALLINSIRGRAPPPPPSFRSGTLMLHINLQGETIKSSHCESGPSHSQADQQQLPL